MAKRSVKEFDELIDIMDILRSDAGCPWDKEQTLHDLKSYLLEETYEVIEAIDSGDSAKIKIITIQLSCFFSILMCFFLFVILSHLQHCR